MKTSPAYMFYASDTMADRRYREMTLEERGLFLSILNECWVNRSVPSDISRLAKWLSYGKDEIEGSLTSNVLSFFEVKDQDLISPDIERYRKEVLDRRAKQSKGGKNGAKAKWQKANKAHDIGNDLPNGSVMTSRVEVSRVDMSRNETIERLDIKDKFVDEINEYEKISNGW